MTYEQIVAELADIGKQISFPGLAHEASLALLRRSFSLQRERLRRNDAGLGPQAEIIPFPR
jgi:hypothetical protein